MTTVLTIDMERIGDLVAVGDHVMFYTARADLADLDGQRFDSAYDAEIAARTRLHARPRPSGRSLPGS
ncbi:MAG: hypothetical protein GVY28_13135 [Alphaproteobacteria bacterium]|jgi:hypothetical protein|nr:hypothetical protein [Alphaproteobacteria bacterium]